MFNANVNKSGHARIVARNTQFVEKMQRVPQVFRIEAGAGHQFIGGNTFINRRADQDLQQIQVFFPVDRSR